MADFIGRKSQQIRKLCFFSNGPNHKNCVQTTLLSLIKQNQIMVIKEDKLQNAEENTEHCPGQQRQRRGSKHRGMILAVSISLRSPVCQGKLHQKAKAKSKAIWALEPFRICLGTQRLWVLLFLFSSIKAILWKLDRTTDKRALIFGTPSLPNRSFWYRKEPPR